MQIRHRSHHRSRWFLSAIAAALLLMMLPVSALAGPPAQPAPGKSEAPVPVRIIRDNYGVPHIYANDLGALFFGYGYAVAEDRLFQLEMTRRSVWGTVAEVLGPDYIGFDKWTRETGYSLAELEERIARLDQQYQVMLTAYARGINEYIDEALANPAEKLPGEFYQLGFRPAPWTAADVAQIFVGTMATRYCDYSMELRNAGYLKDLTDKYGPEQGRQIFDELLWLEDDDAYTTVPGDATGVTAPGATGAIPAGIEAIAARDAAARQAMISALAGLNLPAKAGSNAWLVSGAKSADGSAMLHGGPQMGWFVPGYVHEVGLHGAGFDVVGSTTTGYLPVLFGHNGQIAWTSTAGFGNVVDYFVEQLDPNDPTRYFYKGEWQTMAMRTETIKVKGAPDVQTTVYRTVHGPATVDAANHVAYAKARSWENHELESMAGWIDKTRATNWEAFQTAAEKMAITISWYYADRQGNIGYVFAGRYPVRNPEQDPRLPSPGTGERDWQGFVPARQNPRVFNPAQGYIVNWNQQPAKGWANPDHLVPWAGTEHSAALGMYLDSLSRVTAADMKALNRYASLVNFSQVYFRPRLIAAARASGDARLQAAAACLEQWNGLRDDMDGNGTYDQPGQVIFEAWLTEMLARTFPASRLGGIAGELQYEAPTGVDYALTQYVPWGTRVLKHVLDGKATVGDYLAGQTPEAAMTAALQATLTKLEQAQGADMAGWRTASIHQLFAPVNFLGIPQAQVDGLRTTYYNRGSENHLVSLSPKAVAGENVVPPGESGFVSASGQTTAHYQDQLKLYTEFGYKPMLFSTDEVMKAAQSQEHLLYQP